MPPVTPEAVGRDTPPEAVFVVGVSRSGTTLMRAILNSHSEVAVASENHFMGHLLPWEGVRARLRRVGDLTDDRAVRRVVEILYSDALEGRLRLRAPSPLWRWLRRTVEREELEGRLLGGERSERGVFRTVLRVFADRQGKSIIGEKTPAHLAWAETLLEWFPGGRIIHMIRDPRGVYVSELRVRIARPESVPYRWLVRVPPLLRLFVLHQVAWAWARAVSRHRRLARSHPDQYLLVRFEDLVREPERTIGALCDFMGLPLEEPMLQQKVVSRGGRLGQTGFDAEAADRWRSAIGSWSERWLRLLLGRRLDELGYGREPWSDRDRRG